jgi:hypothetical protein
MFFKKTKKINKLTARVAELEELLCPFNKHDWVEVDYHLTSFDNGYTTDTIYHYKCKRCKKYIETTRVL